MGSRLRFLESLLDDLLGVGVHLDINKEDNDCSLCVEDNISYVLSLWNWKHREITFVKSLRQYAKISQKFRQELHIVTDLDNKDIDDSSPLVSTSPDGQEDTMKPSNDALGNCKKHSNRPEPK